MLGTIVSGSLNSILTKYQDIQCIGHCSNPSKAEYFDQPVLQTLQMFMGELLCWIPILVLRYNRQKCKAGDAEEERNPLLEPVGSTTTRKPSGIRDTIALAIPSTCDLLGTTLMNIGLLYTPVSIYQMTRGSVILIVGLMSVIFLKKRITKIEWLSLFVVFLGVFLVGLSGYMEDQKEVSSVLSSGDVSFDIIVGMVLVFLGITMTAVQFVVEEHILSYLQVEPLEIVGYEGFFGSAVTMLAMLCGYVVYGQGYFDIVSSFKQMVENRTILTTSFLIMLSISVFNFCGITLTSILSATSRSTIDTTRTLLVWAISLAIGWESFHFLQLLAFALLVMGTLSFNGVIQAENWRMIPSWLKDLEGDVRT